MSDEIIICKKCQTIMEFHKSYETILSEGQTHKVEEFRCKSCRITVTKDMGRYIPNSDFYSQMFNREINT